MIEMQSSYSKPSISILKVENVCVFVLLAANLKAIDIVKLQDGVYVLAYLMWLKHRASLELI